MIEIRPISLDSLILDIGIDKDSVIQLLKLYCDEMSEEMQLVRQSLDKQEWLQLQKTVHNIKGVSANLHLHDMFKAAEILDIKLKQNDHVKIDIITQNMLDTFDATYKDIQRILD